MSRFRSNLKNILESYPEKISARGLAEKIGFNRESVRRLYSDEMTDYPGDLLAAICNELGIGIESLLVLDKAEKKDEL